MTHLQSTGCVDVDLHAKNNQQPLRWLIFQFTRHNPACVYFHLDGAFGAWHAHYLCVLYKMPHTA